MEIRHLRSFLALAEHCHFGRAAARIHLSQPALSVQIRSLEAEIGAPLFLRTRHGASLTPVGEALRGEAREILARVEVAKRRIHAAVAFPSPEIPAALPGCALRCGAE